MPLRKRKADNEQIAKAVPLKKAALGKIGTQAQGKVNIFFLHKKMFYRSIY